MRDVINLGPGPRGGPHENPGPGYNVTRAAREVREWRKQIVRHFGPPPKGARFVNRVMNEGQGAFLSLGVRFDTGDRKAAMYAYGLQDERPSAWDYQAGVLLSLWPEMP